MIPKIIHYCWFGSNPMPDSVVKCIDSWREMCPSFELRRWDESNWDVSDNQYVKQALACKKYAFASDYVRLAVVLKYGGVYLDTDVELLKPLDAFLDYHAFFATEELGRVNTGIGFGAEKGNEVVSSLLSDYRDAAFLVDNVPDLTTCVERAYPTFAKLGIKNVNAVQFLSEKRVPIFPPDFFCPEDYGSGKVTLTSNTVSIHHYAATWKSQSTIGRIFSSFKVLIRRTSDTLFGPEVYKKIKKFYYWFRRKL